MAQQNQTSETLRVEAKKKAKYPLYRVEQRKGRFYICDRNFRMGYFVYRTCSNWGIFDTAEAAEAALAARVAARVAA